MIKRSILIVVALLASVVAVQAQVVTPAITFVTLQTYQSSGQSGTDPATWTLFRQQSVAWNPAAFCNLAPITPPAGTVVNPSQAQIDDPDPTHVGKACRFNFAAHWSSQLVAGTGYKSTMTYTYADGFVTPRSNGSNSFDEQPGHPAPTGTGVLP